MKYPISEELGKWIARHMPEVGRLETVRVKECRRVPFSWIPGNRDIQGLTLWNRVYVKDGAWSLELFFHELVHVAQFRRSPFLFPVQYLVQHVRHGYLNNPAEIEAREIAARLLKLFNASSST